MADPQRTNLGERDIEKAITCLKKGAYLLKYGRRGKPKFCPFRLSNDESLLIWYADKEEKHMKLSTVSKIIPGQRTATFRRYPRPEKEYQSFSLICNDRSLDLICKDKEEAEIWFVGLKALVTQGNIRKGRDESKCDSLYSDSRTQRTPLDPGDTEEVSSDNSSRIRFGRAFSEIISYTATDKNLNRADSDAKISLSYGSLDNSNTRKSTVEAFRVSVSSGVSSSSQGSYFVDFDSLCDVFLWGEGIGDGFLGGGVHRIGTLSGSDMDAFLPKQLESKVVLDVQSIACGYQHAVLVTKQGEIFSWGEESGGQLGHGVEADVSHPKLIDSLSGTKIELVACGECHTCAVTLSGDLYTWGDGIHNSGLLGHGTDVSHWIPTKVSGNMESVHVSYVSCGPWHTAILTSDGQLFTFGDGSFGALGHGDHSSTNIPREVETLKGFRTIRVSCSVWHTAAVVEVMNESIETSEFSAIGKLFTWGDGDKGQLGHGDGEPRLAPECVTTLDNENICRVACGHNLTVALTVSGLVYTMGSTAYGQLGNSSADGKVPIRVKGKISDCFVEDIVCGSNHVAVLTSKKEVYTWGKGSNGQLGQGDGDHHSSPTLVEFLKDKQVMGVSCGSNVTAVICLHKGLSSADHSVCSGCSNPFGFRRKRHNCYNCGLIFCKACSSRKSTKASLAPHTNKPYRVCDDCYSKLKKATDSVSLMKTFTSRSKSLQPTRSGKLGGSKLGETISRLSSFGSIVQAERKHSKSPELHDSHVFPSLNGKKRLVASNSPKVSNSLAGASRSSASVPATRTTSKAFSPASTKSSPLLVCEDIHDYLENRNDIPSQEVLILRAQVENLTHKTKQLEAELERKSRQLKEVTAEAADEAEKCKTAREVIKSLTVQLKEMVQRRPEGHIADFYAGATTKSNYFTDESHITTIVAPETASVSNTENRVLPNGAKTQSGKADWVVQDEPGVYITLSSLPGGGNELKRVRFSRRRYTEQQAEMWWAENGAGVLERHNIVSSQSASRTPML